MRHMTMIHIADRAQFDAMVKDHKYVVADFFSTDCPPCANLAPIYEAMANKYPDIPFLKIMRQDHRDLAESFHVMSSPSVLFFRDQKVIQPSLCGSIKEGELDEAIQRLIQPE